MAPRVVELRGSALRDEELPEYVARAWIEECAGWFGPARVPLPACPEKDHLALVRTPLGPAVAKRERRRPPRPSRAPATFHLARDLRAAGVATPRPLACLAPRGGPRVLVSELCGAPTLERVLAERARAADDIGPTLETLARSVARLHASGFRHRDLKAANLLVDAEHVHLLDLDVARPAPSPPGPRVRARDLGPLAASLSAAGAGAHAWRTLVARYLEALWGAPAAPAEAAWLAAASTRWATRHAARVQRRRRPTA